MITIRYINNAGGGFNGRRQVTEGTTIESFFADAMPGASRGEFNIRVNNQVPVGGLVLRDNDLVSIIPGKYDGGALFGAELISNLRAAAELGKLSRQNPDLATDLKAINDLGIAIQAVPGLAANLGAVVEFVRAVQVLDQPAGTGPELAGIGDYRPGIDRVQVEPRTPLEADLKSLFDTVCKDEKAADLTELVRKAGGVAALAAAYRAGTSPQTAVAASEAGPPIDPDRVRLLTGFGLGHDEPVQPGETILAFFDRIKPGRRPEDYRIEVNGQTVEPDYVLRGGRDQVLVRDLNAVKARLARGQTAL